MTRATPGKRVGIAGVSVGALALAATLFVVFFIRGTAGVDDWVVRQVTLIANTYLIPDIGFDESVFEAPGTLRLRGVRLTAPTGEQVLSARELVVTLARAPRIGEPIEIAELSVVGGSLRLLHDPATGGYRGLLPMVRPSARATPGSIPENARLSRVLRIRRIDLRECAVEYDEGDGSPVMRLGGIESVLTVTRTDAGDSSGAVWHALALSARRPGVMSIEMAGAVSLDSLAARLDRLEMSVGLEESTYETLPPIVQALAREHEARGSLKVLASGAGSLSDLASVRLEGTVMLDGFNISAGGYRFPIDSATAEIHIDEGAVRIGPARADLLGGTARLTATADLTTPGWPSQAQWEAVGLELEDLMHGQPEPGAQPPLAGMVHSTGSASASLLELPASIEGRGALDIDRARLVILPVFTNLSRQIDALGSVFAGSSRSAGVRATFDLTDDAVVFDRLVFENAVAVVEATGRVFYDRRLDLTASAGPLKKITGMFGRLGDVIGAVTGRLVQYRIGGTVASPSVEVRPLGLGG